jgi:hypothetical protein
VLWRGQHGDVLDAFVVGFTGAVGGLGLSVPLTGCRGFSVHVRSPESKLQIKQVEKGIKKPPGVPAVFGKIQDVSFGYVQISRPPDARENQK